MAMTGKPRRRRNPLLAVIAVLAVLAWQYFNPEAQQAPVSGTAVPHAGNSPVESAFAAQRSGVWLETAGSVQRILPDDNVDSRHQRFILDIGTGHTVMIAHNIDLADRVPIATGDRLTLRGRYEWNERGGVIHWTHHDPQGREAGGWIRKGATLYQ